MSIFKVCFSFILLLCSLSTAWAEKYQSIPEIHQAMKDGQLTAVQLVKYYTERINTVDQRGPSLNSVALVNEHALAQAAELDKQFKLNGLVGPLHGIPVLLKDNIDTLDNMPNTAGSHALANNFPQDDAFVVDQLRKAGAIILGKTNLSEWANFRSTSSSSGWSGMHGQTRNPYDVTRSPCGSSSGSGVAVAANLSTVAVGTETDGSVVCPSAINGVVGIKPTLGTVSRDGIIPIASSQDTAGPMAKNVTDAVILLTAMVAFDERDHDATASEINYLSHLKADGLKGKRIGIVRNMTGYHRELDIVFEQALEDLKAQGAILVDNANIETRNQWGGHEYQVLLYEFKDEINKYLAGTAEGLPKSLVDLIAFNEANKTLEMPHFAQEIFEMAQAKGDLDSEDYKTAVTQAKLLSQQQGIDQVLETHQLDLLIAPTTSPAWKIDWVNGDNFQGSASSAAAVSGYPSITVPMGFVKGLPVGMLFFSGKLTEGTLIEAAFGYEQATKHRVPPAL